MPTKILVADDSATMRRVLEMTFAGEDASVVSVDSGDAALNKLGDFGPDLVFVDAALAGTDGYEVTRRIKAQQGKVAVIVMASQHNPYDDVKGRAAGVDDHISKPFDTQSVIDRVGQVLARPRNIPSSAAAEAPRAAAPAAVPARPPAPSPMAPAPTATPAASAQRMAQGTRLGIGAPVPMTPAAPAAQATAKPAPAPAPQAAPATPLRANATMPMAPLSPAKPAVAPAPPAVTVSRPPAPTPAAAPAVASVGVQATAELAGKLGQLGLSREQIEGVLALSREIIEQVVWEVVPELAEQLIKEELKRLTAD